MEESVREYQCNGCVSDSNRSDCFRQNHTDLSCVNHTPGTMIPGIGTVFLGMPTGFNRLGEAQNVPIRIFGQFQPDEYDLYNIPVWKYLDANGNTLVRGISPRINNVWIHIYLEDCRDKIDCLEITKEDIESMD